MQHKMSLQPPPSFRLGAAMQLLSISCVVGALGAAPAAPTQPAAPEIGEIRTLPANHFFVWNRKLGRYPEDFSFKWLKDGPNSALPLIHGGGNKWFNLTHDHLKMVCIRKGVNWAQDHTDWKEEWSYSWPRFVWRSVAAVVKRLKVLFNQKNFKNYLYKAILSLEFSVRKMENSEKFVEVLISGCTYCIWDCKCYSFNIFERSI
jgi:hypothetical protein